MGPNGHLTVNQHHPNNLSISLICSYTDPEAYYYTTGMLNGLHEMERFEEGTKRFWEEMKRFEDGTKRFRNGTLCTFGNGTLCTLWPRFQFPRYSDFLAWRIGRLFIFDTQNQNKFHFIRSICLFVIFFDLKKDLSRLINIINLFKQLCLHSENDDQNLGKFTVLKIVTLIDR